MHNPKIFANLQQERWCCLKKNGGKLIVLKPKAKMRRKTRVINPDIAEDWINLGTIAFGKKDWKKAKRCYQNAVKVDPNYPLGWFNLGNAFDELDDIDEAVKCYVRALELEPGYLDAHYNIAVLLQNTQRIPEAIKHWNYYIKWTDKDDPCIKLAIKERDTLLRIHGHRLMKLVKVKNKKE